MKYLGIVCRDIRSPSFPARGTWIEMLVALIAVAIFPVVPREGNVD